MLKKTLASLCVVGLLCAVTWRATGQTDPETVFSPLFIESGEHAAVLANCLDSAAARNFVAPRLAGGPCWISFRSTSADTYGGWFQFSAPQGATTSLLFRYRQSVSPPTLGPGADEIQTIEIGREMSSVVPLLVADPISYELAVEVLSDVPDEIDALLDAGYVLNRVVASRSFHSLGTSGLSQTFSCYLRLDNGVSVRHVAIGALYLGSGAFGPLLVQQ